MYVNLQSNCVKFIVVSLVSIPRTNIKGKRSKCQEKQLARDNSSHFGWILSTIFLCNQYRSITCKSSHTNEETQQGELIWWFGWLFVFRVGVQKSMLLIFFYFFSCLKGDFLPWITCTEVKWMISPIFPIVTMISSVCLTLSLSRWHWTREQKSDLPNIFSTFNFLENSFHFSNPAIFS